MKKDFVYLASASPRRSELLRQIGVPFEVRPADIPETQRAGESADALVLRLAEQKADAVWRRVPAGERRPVLAADTAVVLDERVLGKPADEAEAEAMLASLSGRTHRVLTAVALRCGDAAETLLSSSEVRFRVPSIWDQYKPYIVSVAALCALQAVFILVLLINHRRLRRAHRRRTAGRSRRPSRR